MAAEAVPELNDADFMEQMRKQMNYGLVRSCDMTEELREEAKDTVVTGIEKFSGNYENAAKFIKETMDKKYGPAWHVIVGQGFGFDVTYEMKNLLYMFFGGNVAVLLYKGCAS